MLDLAYNMEAGIAPEMALDEPDVLYSEKQVSLEDQLSRTDFPYSVAPMAKGMPLKTGIDCVSFL